MSASGPDAVARATLREIAKDAIRRAIERDGEDEGPLIDEFVSALAAAEKRGAEREKARHEQHIAELHAEIASYEMENVSLRARSQPDER